MAIEPLFYWHDTQQFLHNRVKQRSNLAELATFNGPPEAIEYALELRKKLKAVMKHNGWDHVQIAKVYDYLDTREPRLAELLKDIKASVDPKGQINPGSLGCNPSDGDAPNRLEHGSEGGT